MKQQQQWRGAMIGVLASFAITSTAWAVVPNENRLPSWGDYGAKTVDFTNIAVNYKSGRLRRGRWNSGSFFGDSQGDTSWYEGPPLKPSTFSLNSLHDGFRDVGFDGDMMIAANIGAKGRLNTRESSFGIYSNDAMFDGPLVTYACDRKGNGCREGKLVYGGDLTAFGWSGSQGLLEFEIGNLHGWAWDQWEASARDGATSREHILLDVGVFDLNGVNRVRAFNAVADGFAVVPVPAAVWLFGSGLLGLIGFAKRKRA